MLNHDEKGPMVQRHKKERNISPNAEKWTVRQTGA